MENLNVNENVQNNNGPNTNDLQKLKSIKGMGIAGLILGIIGWIGMMGYIIIPVILISNDPGIVDNPELVDTTYAFALLASIAVGGLFLGISSILTIVGAIMTLAINWSTPDLKEKRIIWGILGFVGLGPIALIVFGCSKK